MSRGFVRAAVVVLAVVVAAAGCASMKKVSAEEAIAARQQLMKDQGAAMKSIGDKLKAGDTNIAADAHILVESSRRIPTLFPESSINPQVSRAKPEIWQKWSEFEGNAKTLETKAGQLEAMARSGATAQALGAAAGDIGRTVCAKCHDTFRGPEIKK
jgi:cytochrome c556